MNVLFYIYFLVLVFAESEFESDAYKIATDYSNLDVCDQIRRDDQFDCAFYKHNIDSFLAVGKGKAQLAKINENEAYLAAASELASKIQVIAEVHSRDHEPLETVVIVEKGIENFEGLRDKRFCHPGYRADGGSLRILDEFHNTVLANLNINECQENVTRVENKFRRLSEFFGSSSCIPGDWTTDLTLNNNLKNKYSRLCDGCVNGCNTLYTVPFNDSLKCLSNTKDVAVTSLKEAYIFFNTSNHASNYKYFCKDGTVSTSPCVWTKELHDLIITTNEDSVVMRKFLETKIPVKLANNNSLPDIYETAVTTVLRIGKAKVNLVESRSLNSYVNDIRPLPSDTKKACETTIKWCISESAKEKFEWMKNAVVALGLPYQLQSVVDNDCLTSIQDQKSNLTFVNASQASLLPSLGLQLISYAETRTNQLTQVAIVIKNNQSTSLNLNDRDKKACFPHYEGTEQISFLNYVKSKGYISGDLCYSNTTSGYFGVSCMPAANDRIWNLDEEISAKYCGLCAGSSLASTAVYCNADSKNKYYGSSGALRCLEIGDYAVVTLNELYNTTDFEIKKNDYAVYCRNGTILRDRGLDIDDDCAINLLSSGGIAAKKSNVTDDIVLLLRDIEYYFGQLPNKVFRAFDLFDYKKDVLFPDSTLGLVFNDVSNKYVNNLKSIVNTTKSCIPDDVDDTITPPTDGDGGNGAATTTLSFTMILLGAIMLRF